MAQTDYIPDAHIKVLLHDPPGAATSRALYPLTGLDAIVEGTDSATASNYITDATTNKILPKYLGIISSYTSSGTTVYKVGNEYLDLNISGGKIQNTSLQLVNNEGVVDPQYLPSYVDDVIEIPVITNMADATGDLVIYKEIVSNVATYTFKQPSPSTPGAWVSGGGETGKIYIASRSGNADIGAIFRCVSGTSGVEAAKISDNPYVVATSKTNGVYLDTSAGTLTAQADSATYNRMGTVQIDSASVNNAHLGFRTTTNDDNVEITLLGVTVGMAADGLPGVVYPIIDNDTYSAMREHYPATQLVPTAAYMRNFVTSYTPTIDLASYETSGILQVSSGGGLTISGGMLYVPRASAAVLGAVEIVDAINPLANGNASKAVTHSGIVTYLNSNYQPKLSEGSGIDLTSGVASVKVSLPLDFDAGGTMFVSSATAASAGIVAITNDSATIEAGTETTTNSEPIAANPKAIKDYVEAYVSSHTEIPVASTNVRGGFKTSDYTGLVMVGSGDSDILKINTKAPLNIDSNNKLYIAAATSSGLGAVQIGSNIGVTTAGVISIAPAGAGTNGVVKLEITSGGISSMTPTNSGYVPTVQAVSGFVSAYVSAQGLQSALTFSSGVSKNAETNNVTAVVDTTNYPWMALGATGIGVSAASGTQAGVVTLVETSAGIVDTTNSGSVPTASAVSAFVEGQISSLGINGSAQYVDGSASTSSGAAAIPLGGVRIVEGGGISVNIGNLYLSPATSNTLGGVRVSSISAGLELTSSGYLAITSATSNYMGGIRLAATSTGLTMGANAVLKVNVNGTRLYIDPTSNYLDVYTASGTRAGVVAVLATSADVEAASATAINSVPNAAGLKAYVSGRIDALDGAGIVVSNGTASVNPAYPLINSGDYVSINRAVGETASPLTSSAYGAVWVRDLVRDSATITSDAQGITPSTVPTEKAVREAVDTLSSTIDARLYITYTPLS